MISGNAVIPIKHFRESNCASPRTQQLRSTAGDCFILKEQTRRLASRCGRLDSVRWFQWGEWESRRSKCARWRRRGREDRSECAHRQRQTGASATQHLHHTDPHLSRQSSPRPPPLSPLKRPAASAERHLPPLTFPLERGYS